MLHLGSNDVARGRAVKLNFRAELCRRFYLRRDVLKVYSFRRQLQMNKRGKLRYKDDHVGYLWHFGHFMHDLLMPLNDWMTDNTVDREGLVVVMQNTPKQSVGPFNEIVEDFLNVRFEEVSTQVFDTLRGPKLTLNAYLSGPFERRSTDNMLRTAERRYGVSTPPVEPQ